MNYREIIEIIKNNSQDGVEILFNLYAESFYGYAVDKWQFSEDEAYDIVYETLDKLIEKLPQGNFSSQGKFDGYIYTIFRSRLAKRYHKKKRNRKKMTTVSIDAVSEGAILNIPMDSVGFPESDSYEVQNIKKALMELSEFERELLLLKAENNTYQEIAQMLNVENNNLKGKYFRAKQKLIIKMKKIKNA